MAKSPKMPKTPKPPKTYQVSPLTTNGYDFVSPAADYTFPSGTQVDVIVSAPTNGNYPTVYALKVIGLSDPQDGLPPTLVDLGFFTAPTAGTDVSGTTQYTFSVTLTYSSRVISRTTSAMINFCEAVTSGGTTTWQVRRTLNITLTFPQFFVLA